ncbi:MAG: NAD(P)/FAD-dependent oxidoreductase [Saprospiraceae bacterium]|nr:NAD(P)/FAD-dependent oxidoreductase [Saprospiraceae bacterium]MCF8251616.1 NAD(P)/FAD-dependent oxidoreductase [Saprospiraceae bacterium]MCF8281337.1 NAD(P)/FAD-dependent oxidoreductase [Bacteroidales bacterium]MCF8312294.1 NAD(P)/FAD-dependent oxidoreductase [Saprospiraceae bacterium]MCF8442002.1 NAD(P)/FAD-dependent oxidoreductase [Saprospiraceae bacterium]
MAEKIFCDFLVIGGGAAGFFAAIRAAECSPGARVIILEKGREVLQKVKVSGGGRCNVTHACFDPRELVKHYPRGSKALLGPFSRFQPGDTVAWFEQRGVRLKAEEDGRMFPVTDSSQTIINCLQQSANKTGVQVLTGENVQQITPPKTAGGLWSVASQSGTIFQTKKLMVATGSSARIWQLLGELGHSIVPAVPSLFTFNVKGPRLTGLMGLSVPSATVRVLGEKLTATGPLLITHWGMSGPGILRLSAWGARILAEKKYNFDIEVSWLNYSADEMAEELGEAKLTFSKKLVASQNPFPTLPRRLWESLVAASGIASDLRWADLPKEKLRKLAIELGAGQYHVSGKSTFKEEFVTAGGIALDEVNFKTFESKIHPGLHFAGEVLDIDAITGGFNFQAAWTGGWLVGSAVGKNA